MDDRNTIICQQIFQLSEVFLIIFLPTFSNIPTETIRSNFSGYSR
jgi:hypothetical protein